MTGTPPTRSFPIRTLLLYLAVPALFCAWVLSMPVFPSQDGPLHLYYVNIFRQLLAHTPGTYIHAFYINRYLPPYSLYYYGLIALGSIVSLPLADKLLVCLFFVLFALGIRALCRTVAGPSTLAPFLALPLLLNWPLVMGFVNYSLATAIACFALAVWCRSTGRPGLAPRALFLLLLTAVILTHPVPWIFVLAFAFFDLALRLLRSRLTTHNTVIATEGGGTRFPPTNLSSRPKAFRGPQRALLARWGGQPQRRDLLLASSLSSFAAGRGPASPTHNTVIPTEGPPCSPTSALGSLGRAAAAEGPASHLGLSSFAAGRGPASPTHNTVIPTEGEAAAEGPASRLGQSSFAAGPGPASRATPKPLAHFPLDLATALLGCLGYLYLRHFSSNLTHPAPTPPAHLALLPNILHHLRDLALIHGLTVFSGFHGEPLLLRLLVELLLPLTLLLALTHTLRLRRSQLPTPPLSSFAKGGGPASPPHKAVIPTEGVAIVEGLAPPTPTPPLSSFAEGGGPASPTHKAVIPTEGVAIVEGPASPTPTPPLSSFAKGGGPASPTHKAVIPTEGVAIVEGPASPTSTPPLSSFAEGGGPASPTHKAVIPTEGVAIVEGPASPTSTPQLSSFAEGGGPASPTHKAVIPTEGVAVVEGPASPTPTPHPSTPWTPAHTWLAFALTFLLLLPFLPDDLNGSHYFALRLLSLLYLSAIVAAAPALTTSRLRLPLAAAAILTSLLSLHLATRFLSPAARTIATLDRVPNLPPGPGLLLRFQGQLAPPGLIYDPFFWAGAHVYRRQNLLLVNSAWLELAIIPVKPLPSTLPLLDPTFYDETPRFSTPLMRTPEEAHDLLAKAASILALRSPNLPRSQSLFAPTPGDTQRPPYAAGWICLNHPTWTLCTPPPTHTTTPPLTKTTNPPANSQQPS